MLKASSWEFLFPHSHAPALVLFFFFQHVLWSHFNKAPDIVWQLEIKCRGYEFCCILDTFQHKQQNTRGNHDCRFFASFLSLLSLGFLIKIFLCWTYDVRFPICLYDVLIELWKCGFFSSCSANASKRMIRISMFLHSFYYFVFV